MLILELDPCIFDKFHDGLIIDQDVTLTGWTGDGLAGTLVHDLGRQVLGPTGGAVHVPALQACHHLRKKPNTTTQQPNLIFA
jgi:hypothetical protein